MAQDWFSANAPKPAQGGDWFATNAPQPEGKSVGGFLSNALGDAGDTISGVVSMLNPANWDGIARNVVQGKQQYDEQSKQAVSDVQRGDFGTPMPIGQRARGIADEIYQRPVGAALELAPMARPVVGLSRIKAPLENTGVRMMRGAVKPNTGDLNKVAGASQAGLDKVSDDIARTALTERVNPLTKGGLETIQRRVEGLGVVRDTDIAAAPQVPVAGSGTRQLQSLRPVVQRYRNQSTPEADVKAVSDVAAEIKRNPRLTETPIMRRTVPGRETTIQPRRPLNAPTGDEALVASGDLARTAPTRVFQPTTTEARAARELGPTALTIPRSVLNAPARAAEPTTFVSAPRTINVRGTRRMRDLTPDELNVLNKGDNKALVGKFGKVGDAEIDARKAVVGARRDMLEEVVPGTKETGQRMRRLIDLRNVSNVARKRSEGRDGLSLGDLISLNAGSPAGLAASTVMRPAAQAGIAGGLYRTGAALPSQIDLTDLYRLALIQQLTGASEPEGPR